ncbi:hypothetical protein NSTC745_01103 [Nostoc sp. DSM 114161]|jgi:hypothetical protein
MNSGIAKLSFDLAMPILSLRIIFTAPQLIWDLYRILIVRSLSF